MSQYAIQVHQLGKRYHIGALKQNDNLTLAATLARSLRQPMRRITDLLRGNQTGAADLDREFWALRNVSFTVEHGETVGVIGQNGAGKSTLLKLLSKITYPNEGWARINGRVGSLLEVGTGFNPELTGRENVYLNGAILGMLTGEIRQKFDEIVSFAGVEAMIDTPVKHYSSGMRVRLAFAVAAHLEPEILLIDEVLAVGDYAFQKKSLGKMQDVTRSGRTVLFVSHQLDMVREICDRVILLRNGEIQMIGNTDQVINAYIEQFNVDMAAASEFTCDPPAQPLPFRLLGGRLLNAEGRLANHFDMFDPITIELDYEIDEPVVGVVLNFIIRNVGQVLATSFDTDTQPELLDSRLPGKYCEKVTLPTPFLKEGSYSLDITLSYIKDRGAGRHFVSDALAFEVELLSRSGANVSYSSNRHGKVSLELEWDVEQLQ